jgi:hypothetical protein
MVLADFERGVQRLTGRAGEDHYSIFARFDLFVLLGNSTRSRYRPLGGASLRSATVPSGCGILKMSKP